MKCRLCFAVVFFTLLCLGMGFSMKTVFIVQSYDPDFIWSQQLDQGV